MGAPTLLVLAAGMGSRFGGLKQMEAFGPGGGTLLDYSSHDALRAGFGRLVFVIRRDFADAFERAVAARWRRLAPVELVYQDADDLPAPHRAPAERAKPWGTTHAVLAARHAVHEPFLMINADDFYGRETFRVMADFLRREPGPGSYAMAGFRLAETLSPHGGVTRAFCRLDGGGRLAGLEELQDVRVTPQGGVEAAGRPLDPGAPVSMNCFGFGPDVFPLLMERFAAFLAEKGGQPRSECLIPESVGDLVRAGAARVEILPTPARWFGVTFPADRERVQAEIGALHARGDYPPALWSLIQQEASFRTL